MKIKRYCELCGADYWTGNGKAKYCSEACRKEATRRRQVKWRVDNPDYQKKYAEEHPKAQERFKERHPNYERDRWRKIRGTIEQTKVCIVCGKEFITTRPQKMTCSEECKRINCKEKQRERSKRRELSPEEEHRKYIIHTYGSEEAHAAYLEKKQAQIAQTKAHREHMTLIAEYESTAEAERVTGIAQKKIQDCARGRHKTSGGYVWRYA